MATTDSCRALAAAFSRAVLLSAAVLGVLLLVGCKGGLRANCTVPPVYAGPPTQSAPEPLLARDFGRSIHGELPADLQASLSKTLDDILDHVPGASVAVAIPGEGMWFETRGLARTVPRTEVFENQMFQVASTGKTFTAAVILQLVQEGRLRLDQTVESWFPDVPNARLITVEQLLNHTSGLASFNAKPLPDSNYRTPAELIAIGAAESPLFCPGTNFAYSNTGYVMLGVIIEQLEQRPLRDVLAARILEPLSLKHTVLRQPEVELPVVTGHDAGEPVTVDGNYASPHAAGALASTAADLVLFWHALLRGDIVSDASLSRMFTEMPMMSADGQFFYGLGVQLFVVPDGPGLMLGHGGGITGFTSVVAYLAEDDAYVAVVFNDKTVAAQAGLWALTRALRTYRSANGEQ